MQDKIEIYGAGSLLQHGKLSDRVYLIKLDKADLPNIIEYINDLARTNSYTKLFCKVPFWASPLFISAGFMVEAHIPDFFASKDDVFFLSKFLSSDRCIMHDYSKLFALTELLQPTFRKKKINKLKSGFNIKILTADYVEEISGVYKKVFDSYPFPIFKPEYILETLKNNVQYFGIESDGQLISLASAEVDKKGENAEMTDFATLSDYRGNGLSFVLLNVMEQEMKKQGITTLYTIARLNSIAMNKTFINSGYKYAGTLINNTNISGKIESMNVFYKLLIEYP